MCVCGECGSGRCVHMVWCVCVCLCWCWGRSRLQIAWNRKLNSCSGGDNPGKEHVKKNHLKDF